MQISLKIYSIYYHQKKFKSKPRLEILSVVYGMKYNSFSYVDMTPSRKPNSKQNKNKSQSNSAHNISNYDTTRAIKLFPAPFSKFHLLGPLLKWLLYQKDRDPSLPQAYWPISLLNIDYKMLMSILSSRLNSVIVNYVHADQSGFIKNRFWRIIFRR